MKYISYLRVSTKRQGQSGLGLEAQREAVARYLESVGGELEREFQEVESGTNNDRPVLKEALDFCNLHNRNRTKVKLVIAKLDRLSRSAAFLTALQEAGVPFVCADLPEADHLSIGIMALLARWEAEKISERTKAALKAKEARGEKINRYRPAKGTGITAETRERAYAAKRLQAAERAEQYRAIFAKLKESGITSYRGMAIQLTKDEIPNPSGEGCNWAPIQVSRICKRLEENEKHGSYLL